MPDLATGSIRTVTTLVIGAFLTAGVDALRRETGIQLPSDPLTINVMSAVVYAFVTALWYLVFASLERRWPIWGVFLGWPKAPHYPDPHTTEIEIPGGVLEVKQEVTEEEAEEIRQRWLKARGDDPLP